jgi:VanZ family protein
MPVTLSDKAWHFLAYAATVGLFLLAAVWRPGRGPGIAPWAAPYLVVGGVVAGSLIEIIQTGFNRHRDVKDALADLAGSLVAFGVWWLIKATDPDKPVEDDAAEDQPGMR